MNERVLVGIVPSRGDLQILEQQNWYRIPVDSRIRNDSRWPPRWFAAFETVEANGRVQQVSKYAEIRGFEERTREELFQTDAPGPKAGKRYIQLMLGPIQSLSQPLRPLRSRRTPFIHTTMDRLVRASGFNDLFNDSPFENELWNRFKELNLDAERQWGVKTEEGNFILDFAVFCELRKLDVEVDGPAHHALEQRSISDAERDRVLSARGWLVQRFRTQEVQRKIEYCLERIWKAVDEAGGMRHATRVVRGKSKVALQPALLEGRFTYDSDEEEAEYQ